MGDPFIQTLFTPEKHLPMITQLFRSTQESEASRIGRMSERVAVASIDSQKQADEFDRQNGFAHAYYMVDESRPRAFNSFTCMNSYFAGRVGGSGSSFKAARYYADQAKARRDELVKQVEESSTSD